MPDPAKTPAAGLAHESVQPIGRRVRVRYGSFTLVDTREALLFHGRGRQPVVLVPRRHLPVEFLPDDGRIGAPQAGHPVRYWNFSVGGRTAENGVWSFERPQDALAELAGYVAFDTAQVVLEVDGDDDEPVDADVPDPSEAARPASHLRE